MFLRKLTLFDAQIAARAITTVIRMTLIDMDSLSCDGSPRGELIEVHVNQITEKVICNCGESL